MIWISITMLRGQSPMAVAPLLDPWTKRKRRFGEEAEEEMEAEGEEEGEEEEEEEEGEEQEEEVRKLK